jgi:hypothetical protein
MTKAKTLGRIHRVRTLQLGLARADEMRHHDAVASETALNRRIAGLVDAVAPSVELLGAHSLAASAHYRERLQHSAVAAAARVQAASSRADAAVEASRAAKRDQSAVEKLLDRARATASLREMRALEDTPTRTKSNRHDPC